MAFSAAIPLPFNPGVVRPVQSTLPRFPLSPECDSRPGSRISPDSPRRTGLWRATGG